jgi:twitching motility protein PilJ
MQLLRTVKPLRRNLEEVQTELSGQTGIGGGALTVLVLAAAFALTCAGGSVLCSVAG